MGLAVCTTRALGATYRLATFNVALLVEYYVGDCLSRVQTASLSISVISGIYYLFAIGAFLMRGAGCSYNDLADIDIDDQVERTRSRPLPSGRIKKKQAAIFLVVLVSVAQGFTFAFWLGVASLVTVAIYPFMKRITWWPQLFLGFAFSWGALMGWAVVAQTLSLAPILLYIGHDFICACSWFLFSKLFAGCSAKYYSYCPSLPWLGARRFTHVLAN